MVVLPTKGNWVLFAAKEGELASDYSDLPRQLVGRLPSLSVL